MKNVTIISLSNISVDGRVLRQINSLKDLYEITVIGLGEKPGIDMSSYIRMEEVPNNLLSIVMLILLLIAGKVAPLFYEIATKFYGSRRTLRYKTLCRAQGEIENIVNNSDIVIANDLDSFEFIAKLRGEKTTPKVIFDMHEYFPLEWESKILFKILLKKYLYYRCKKYLKMADSHFTVGNDLARRFKEELFIKPQVIMNCPHYNPSTVSFT